jgi:rfaE bifunctional protein kinase chain/domain
MSPERFQELTARYASLRLAVIGDFCLDRYLEIDPARSEVSIETGLPVHNVIRLRAQPGGAGTILNNLVALGVGHITPIGFCGDDGEGFELKRSLAAMPGVATDYFVVSGERRTFTYCKPLVIEPGKPPVELNRLDSKNWTPTPEALVSQLAASVRSSASEVDGVIVLDQVDAPDTGVVTRALLETIDALAAQMPALPILADSRRGLAGWPPLSFKTNAAELAVMLGRESVSLDAARQAARELAAVNRRPVFVTLAERGILGAAPDGTVEHVEALPLRGPIDVVGAGDSVTANLTTALAAGASIREAIELAVIASSIVIHELGTTGTASVPQISRLLRQIPSNAKG